MGPVDAGVYQAVSQSVGETGGNEWEAECEQFLAKGDDVVVLLLLLLETQLRGWFEYAVSVSPLNLLKSGTGTGITREEVKKEDESDAEAAVVSLDMAFHRSSEEWFHRTSFQ